MAGACSGNSGDMDQERITVSADGGIVLATVCFLSCVSGDGEVWGKRVSGGPHAA